MIVAFFESVKYSGHLIPVSFLRIFLGYYYLQDAFLKFSGDFLVRPRIAELISENLPTSHAPDWYKLLFSSYLVSHWQILAFIYLGLQFAIAVSYILGYVVRPVGILAALFTFQLLYLSGHQAQDFLKILLAVHVSMAWLGAGRCLGIDYYFFKRIRGFWW
jgi:thiosulfate dehydrogenase [quinone] large subunit